VLGPEEIERLARFGERKSYMAGERMAATGEIAPGVFVILRGRVDVTQRGGEGQPELIFTHGPGSFMGELAQLSDRPYWSTPTPRKRSRRSPFRRAGCAICWSKRPSSASASCAP